MAERYGADYRPGLEAAAPDGLLVGVVRLGSRIQLGILLAITILATAGWVGRRDTAPEVPSSWAGDPRGDLERGRVCTSPWRPGRDYRRLAVPVRRAPVAGSWETGGPVCCEHSPSPKRISS